jgi:hypothetical protein
LDSLSGKWRSERDFNKNINGSDTFQFRHFIGEQKVDRFDANEFHARRTFGYRSREWLPFSNSPSPPEL